MLLAVILLAGLGLRLRWIEARNTMASAPTPGSTRSGYSWMFDEYLYYVSTAKNAVLGHGFSPDYNTLQDGVIVVPPLQPIFLFGIFRLFSASVDPNGFVDPRPAQWLQALLWIAAILAAFDLGCSLRSKNAGYALASTAALYPPFVYWTGFLMSENNFVVLLILFLTALVRAEKTGALKWFTASGILLGLLTLQRPLTLLLAPCLGAAFWFSQANRKAIALLVILPYLIMTPWLVRNLRVYHEPIWVSSNGGILLYLFNRPAYDPWREPFYEDVLPTQAATVYNPDLEARLRDANGKLRVSYYAYSQQYEKVLLQQIASQPLRFLRNYSLKFLNQFRLHERVNLLYNPDSLWMAILRVAVFLLGLLGVIRSLRRRTQIALLATLAYFALFGALFHLTDDGRMTLGLQTLLLVFGGLGVATTPRSSKTAPSSKPNRFFYTLAAVFLLLLGFVGFSKFYLHGQAYPGREIAPPIRSLVILHAIAMSAWLLLFVAQPLLIARNHRRTHMALGRVGAMLAAAIIILGIGLAIQSTKLIPPEAIIWGLSPKQFMAVPLGTIAMFAGCVGLGVFYRRRLEIHRPMMLLATLSAVGAAVSRIDFLNHLYGGTIWERLFGPFFITLLIGVVLLFIRCVIIRSLDRWFAAGLAGLIVVSILIMQCAPTVIWNRFASLLVP